MRPKGLPLLSLGIALLLAACGDGRSTGLTGSSETGSVTAAVAPQLNVTGTYVGTAIGISGHGAGETADLDFMLKQTGGSISGTYELWVREPEDHDNGTVTGTLSGAGLNLHTVSAIDGDACDLTGRVSSGGDAIAGNIRCITHTGHIGTGTFMLNRTS